MAWTISPDSYDVVVIGSGLPECLVAASLVKSGKSVLIIDAVDTYGTDFASFTPVALNDVLSQQSPTTRAPGAASGAPPDGAASGGDRTPPQRQEQHEHSVPECSPVSQPLPRGCRLLRLRQRPLPLSGIRALAVPGEGGGPADRRGYIIDLVPKLVYQSEPLVDMLVRCRCHHYLEFKAVEGSYLLQEGALQQVPAGRADIFRDRRLSLADKRVLMRFIQGCVEARSGQGHLKEALSSSTPLAQVLANEGLPPRLQEVILYGIAMCDIDQAPPPPSSTSTDAPAAAAATEVAAAPSSVDGSGGGGGRDGVGRGGGGRGGGGGLAGGMTGADGGAALDLFTSSQGRFGHEGAFMLPSYGSGSVAEAFVRLCAVHGAVTVLRQPVQALAVGLAAPGAAGEAATGAEAEATAVGAEAEATAVGAVAEATAVRPVGEATAVGRVAKATAVAEAEATAVAEAEATAVAEAQVDGALGDGAASEEPEAAGATRQGPAGDGGMLECGAGGCGRASAGACVAVVTGAGQVVRCGAVVAGSSTLSGLEGFAPLTPAASVSRAVVVLDGPLLPPASRQQAAAGQAPQSLLTLVVPPRCQGLSAASGGGGRGGGLGNPHPVRLLQEGAATCVCPAGRFLLYLSTPATSASSYDDLWPTLDELVDTSGLQDVTTADMTTATAASAPTPTTASTTAPLVSESPAAADSSARPSEPGASASAPPPAGSGAPPGDVSGSTGASPAPPHRPRALRAWLYRQPVLHHSAGALAGQLPAGVVAVPGPDGSLAGYGEVLRATEAVCRSAFPEVTWLAEVEFGGQGGDGEEGGGGGGSGGGDRGDDDDDAIDELTAAVARLKDA